MANSIFVTPGVSSSSGGGGASFPGAVTAGSAATGSFYAADGTALLPAYSFSTEPTLGFWRSSASNVMLQGSLNTTGSVRASGALSAGSALEIYWVSRALLKSPTDGSITIATNNEAIGARLKVDALPTVASGFGGSPAVTAGSTPLAGSVNVGTGGVATSGVINFNGTAFPSAPFCLASATTTLIVVSATATTTQLTLSSTTPWAANDVIKWICISSK